MILETVFKKFAMLVPDHGYVIINSDIDKPEYFTSDLSCHVITFGSDPEKKRLQCRKYRI